MSTKQKPPAAHGAHWTKGKRRNADAGDWTPIRLAIQSLIGDHFRIGIRSARAIADSIGVTDRTVRRWLSGEDRPSPELQDLCRAWVADQRRRLKKP